MAYCNDMEDLPQETPLPTRNVFLADHPARLVERPVSSGRYRNASEALREGLRLAGRRESGAELRLSALRVPAEARTEAGNFRRFDIVHMPGEHG